MSDASSTPLRLLRWLPPAPLRCPLVVVLIGALLAACAHSQPPGIHARKVVDLTYAFGPDTIYWPTNKTFEWEKTAWGMTDKGYWYTSGAYGGSEHGGTHIDAPIHFGEGRMTVDELPVDRLIGPAVVVDVRAQCQANADYELSVGDLLAWEARHGTIDDGAIVFMLSGWGARWPDRSRYLGSASLDDASGLHFPGFSEDAARFLVKQRSIRGVGIDTASIDPGPSRDFLAHRVLNGADIYALENVASLEKLPPRGATVFALPMKIRGGTGSPVRIIALLP